MKDQNPKILSISSGKGGVGKTSIAVNLAFALHKRDKRVLLVDGDLGLANIDIMLRLSVNTTIRDILENGAEPLKAVVYLDRYLGVLPASSGVPEMVSLGPEEQNRLNKVLRSIAINFDYVVLDTAAGIGPTVLWFNGFADQNVVILTPTPTSLTDAYALIKTISAKHNRKKFYLIVNLAKDNQRHVEISDRLENAVKQFLGLTLEYLGIIPEDKAVNTAVIQQRPFFDGNPDCEASKALLRLADRIISDK